MRGSTLVVSVLLSAAALVGHTCMGFPLDGGPDVRPSIPKEKIPEDIPDEVREAILGLYSSDPVARIYYTVHLGKLGERAAPAVPFLVSLLGRDDGKRFGREPPDLLKCTIEPGDFRNLAAEALRSIGEPAVKPLLAALKDENAWVRANAARALGWARDPRAVQPLITALNDQQAAVGRIAAEALGQIADPRAARPLIEALKDSDDSSLARPVIDALTRIGRPCVIPLIDELQHPDPSIRASAAEALGCLRDRRAVGPLVDAYKQQRVGYNALLALGRIDDPRGIEVVIRALKHKDQGIRYCLAKALAYSRDPRAADALLDAVEGPTFFYAARSLVAKKDWRVVEPLLATLRGKGGYRRQAHLILYEMTGKSFGFDAKKWQAWWDQNKEDLLEKEAQ